MAVLWAPKNELSHYAYSLADLAAIGRVADRLKRLRNRKLIYGPSRHGPGNNLFAYFFDNDGAMVELCAELALMPPAGDYRARKWPLNPTTINQWGGPPPLQFIRAGYPIATAGSGTPSRRATAGRGSG